MSLESTGGGGGEAAEDQEEIPVVAWLDIVEYVENGFFIIILYSAKKESQRRGRVWHESSQSTVVTGEDVHSGEIAS